MRCRWCGGDDNEFCFNIYCPYDDNIVKEYCDSKLFLNPDDIDYNPNNKRDKRGSYINHLEISRKCLKENI